MAPVSLTNDSRSLAVLRLSKLSSFGDRIHIIDNEVELTKKDNHISIVIAAYVQPFIRETQLLSITTWNLF